MTLRRSWVPVVFCCLLAGRAAAAVPPEPSALREKVYHHPDLHPAELQERVRSLDAGLAARLETELASMGVGPDSGYYDSRAGRWGSLILSVPLIPGSGNDLRWETPPPDETALRRRAWSALKARLVRLEHLRLDPAELPAEPSVGVLEGGALVSIHAPRVVRGVACGTAASPPSSTTATSSSSASRTGQTWSRAAAPRSGPRRRACAVVRPRAALRLTGSDAGRTSSSSRSAGRRRYEYRLAWVVASTVAGDLGSWEGIVDAAQRGAARLRGHATSTRPGKVVGGVYPVSNDRRPPDGVEQAGWPMPFADVAATRHDVHRHRRHVSACATGDIRTTLAGRSCASTTPAAPSARVGRRTTWTWGSAERRHRLRGPRRPFRRRHARRPHGVLRG